MSASALAFVAGLTGAIAGADLVAGVVSHAAARGAGGAGQLRAAAEVFARAGSVGRDPRASERRRLLALGGLTSLVAGWFVFGPPGAIAAAAAAPAVASRALRARRDRYRRAVEAGAGEIAAALADALSGGHSLRGALQAAPASLRGAAGHELRRVARELELGAPTDEALEAMRRRIGSPAIDAIVAGALLQRGSGGDLASLLRGCARAFEDEARLLGEVRAATAQARFTGMVVVLLPLGGAGMAELASPGFAGNLIASPLSAWLLGMSVAMQVAAGYAIRRLSRIRA